MARSSRRCWTWRRRCSRAPGAPDIPPIAALGADWAGEPAGIWPRGIPGGAIADSLAVLSGGCDESTHIDTAMRLATKAATEVDR
jgi:hypothetical protein